MGDTRTTRQPIPGPPIPKISTKVAFFLVLLLCCPALREAAGQSPTPRRPVARVAPYPFPTSTPEEQGMDSSLLAQAVDHFLERRDLYNIHSMTVVRHGHVVANVYFYPFQHRSIHGLASASKVFLTTLIGIAIDTGYIASVDKKVVDFFPDRTIANRDAWKEAMTVEHLLTMTSGLGFDDRTDEDGMRESDDWVQFALDLPMSHEPGTWWNYHQPTAFLLSAIISKTTGMNALAFARRHLFRPLRFSDSFWTESPNGINSGHNELFITPHDFAKFGQLFAQNGSWNGRQLVPRAWVDTATSVLVGQTYGYMWYSYTDRPGVSIGGGAAGQRLVVSPARDLIVAFTGGGYDHADIELVYLEALDSFIFPAVQLEGSLPANQGGLAQLEDAIERAASPGREPLPVEPLPDIAGRVSGQTFVMGENPGEILTVTPTFPERDQLRARITSTGKEGKDDDWIWAFGLDGIVRCSRAQIGALACGTGEWLDDRTLEMTVDTLGLYEVYRLTLAFLEEGQTLEVTVEDLDRFEPDPTWTMIGTKQN